MKRKKTNQQAKNGEFAAAMLNTKTKKVRAEMMKRASHLCPSRSERGNTMVSGHRYSRIAQKFKTSAGVCWATTNGDKTAKKKNEEVPPLGSPPEWIYILYLKKEEKKAN